MNGQLAYFTRFEQCTCGGEVEVSGEIWTATDRPTTIEDPYPGQCGRWHYQCRKCGWNVLISPGQPESERHPHD